MPLVWAHAEYVKLLRSLRDGRVFDLPPQPVQRYQVDKIRSPHHVWRFNQKCRAMAAGKTLRIEALAPAVVRWTADDWRTIHDIETRSTSLGVHLSDVPTGTLPAGATLRFTFRWPPADRWEGMDFAVRVMPPGSEI
jgi:glucoamylase